jgi:transposase
LNRSMANLKFFQFKERLKHKCEQYKNNTVHIVNEAYTSKTCTQCGHCKKPKEQNLRDRVYNCRECHLVIDRDVNGSRNIYLRNINLVPC